MTNLLHSLVVGSTVGERVGLQCSWTLAPSYTRLRVSSTRVRSLVFYARSVGLLGGPNTSLLSFTHFCSPYHRPLVSGPQAHFVPKRRSQRGVVDSRAITTLSLLLEFPPFIGPNSLSLDITYHMTNTSLPVRDFSSRRTHIFNINFFTHFPHLS